MIDLVKNFRFSGFQIFPIIVIIISFCSGCSFTDNATKLAYELESSAETLKSQQNGSEVIVKYETKDSKAPFTILVLSEKGITSDELYEMGLDSVIVKDLFPQLSYIDLKNGATLIVYQNGGISFTTYYRRFVDVKATQIINGTGNSDIVVKKTGVGPGHFTEEIIQVELRKL